MESDSERGTGRTTRQIENAPQKAIFICVHRGAVGYTRELARRLGRNDLQFEDPTWLDGHRWKTRILSGVVVDHAAELTGIQLTVLHEGVLPLIRNNP